MSLGSSHPTFFRFLMQELENKDLVDDYKPHFSWAYFNQQNQKKGISQVKLQQLQQKKKLQKKKLAAIQHAKVLRQKSLERSERSKSRNLSRDRKYGSRHGDDVDEDYYTTFAPIRQARHSEKSIEKRKWRKQKKVQAKLNATKVAKKDMVKDIQAGLEQLDLDDVEVGQKFLSMKKTCAQFAATLPIDRQRKDYRLHVQVNGVVFEVYHRNMQDEDYLINKKFVKLRNVTDKYCFFKSLLNVCKITGEEEQQYSKLMTYAKLVTKLYKQTTPMRQVKEICIRLGDIRLLDIGSVHEYLSKQNYKPFEAPGAVLVFVTDQVNGHIGYLEGNQTISLDYVIELLQLAEDKSQPQYAPSYQFEVRAPVSQMAIVTKQKKIQQAIIKEELVAEKKVKQKIATKGAKLFIMTEEARKRLDKMPEHSKTLANESSWALFVVRSKNKLPGAIMPKAIESRQSFFIASLIKKKDHPEWVQHVQKEHTVVPMEFDPIVKQKLFAESVKIEQELKEKARALVRSRVEKDMASVFARVKQMFAPVVEEHKSPNVSKDVHELFGGIQIGRVCGYNDHERYLSLTEQYLQGLTVDEEYYDDCDVVQTMTRATGVYLVWCLIYILLIYLIAYLGTLWYLRKPLFKQFCYYVLVGCLGYSCKFYLAATLVCKVPKLGYDANVWEAATDWKCDGPMSNQFAYMLSFGYIFMTIFLAAYSFLIGLIFFVILTWNLIKMYARQFLKVFVLSLILASMYQLQAKQVEAVCSNTFMNFLSNHPVQLFATLQIELFDIFVYYLLCIIFIYVLFIAAKIYRFRQLFHRVEIADFTPRKINQFVMSKISKSALLQMYSKPVDPTRAQGKCSGIVREDNKRYPRSVKCIPAGYISRRVNECLNIYGIGFTTQQLSMSKVASLGVSHQIALQRKMLLRELQPIFKRYQRNVHNAWHSIPARQYFEANPLWTRKGNAVMTIFDPTFSYQLIADIIRCRYAIDKEDVFSEKRLRKDLTAEMKQNLPKMWSIIDNGWIQISDSMPGQLLGAINQVYTDVVYGPAGAQILVMDYFQTLMTDHQIRIADSYRRYPIAYVPVQAPGCNDSIQQRFDSDLNYQVYVNSPVLQFKNSWVWMKPVRKTALKQCEMNMGQDDSALILIDCNELYEFDETRHRSLYIISVDTEFNRMPGHYNLVQGEGTFQVYRHESDGRVRISSGCSGVIVDRPLLRNRNVKTRIDLGWYSYVSCGCDSAKWSTEVVYLPKYTMMEDGTSVQKQFFRDYIYQLGDLNALKSFATVKEQYSMASDLDFKLARVYSDFLQKVISFCIATHDYAKGQFSVIQYRTGGFWFTLAYFFTDLQFLRNVRKYNHSHYKQRTHGYVDFELMHWRRKDDEDDDYDTRWRNVKRQYNRNQVKDIMMGAKFEAIQDNYKHEYRMSQKQAALIIQDYVGKPERTKSVMSSLGKKFGQVQQTFFCKPTPLVKRVPDYMCDQKYRMLSDDTVEAVNTWLCDHPQPVFYGNNDRTTGVTTKTGYSLISDQREYQWSSRCVHNAIYGLYHRQLACNLYPQATAVQDFGRTMGRWFSNTVQMFKKQLLTITDFDAFQIIKQKNFQRGKKLRYLENLRRLFIGQKQAIGCFTTMIKSGQVYFSNLFQKINGFLVGKDDRPRNIMVPSQALCGILCALQTVFWTPLKRVLPSFIQGMTKKQLKALIKSKVKQGWKAICIDGSAFDSTQNAIVMALIDTVFFKGIEPAIRHLLTLMKQKYPHCFKVEVGEVVRIVMEQATNLNNYCFTQLPGIKRVHWPDQVYKIFMSNYKQKCVGRDRQWVQSNYIVNVIRGTTFSGHPTKTTLGNTLRSICYAYYYLIQAGVKQPWNNSSVFVIASGDDVVIFCDPNLAKAIEQSILRNTSRFKGTEAQFGAQGIACGLGQCVKSVLVVEWYQFDFCSKWSFGSTFEDFELTRDIKKTLTTRQYYTKENADILSHPMIHAQAILESVQSQHVSHLIQDLLRVRVKICEKKYGIVDLTKYDLTKVCDKLKYSFSDDTGYLAQSQVNNRVGVDLKTLIDLWQSQYLNTSIGARCSPFAATVLDCDSMTTPIQFNVDVKSVDEDGAVDKAHEQSQTVLSSHSGQDIAESRCSNWKSQPPQRHSDCQSLSCCY